MIRKTTIEKYGASYLFVAADNLLSYGLLQLDESKKTASSVFLVTRTDDGLYRVVLFSSLSEIIMMMGNDALEVQLALLPLPPASRVESVHSDIRASDLLDWLALHPTATVVLIDNEKVVGVLVNPNRAASGIAESVSIDELHGELAQLAHDPRLKLTQRTSPPTCPFCHKRTYFRFDTQAHAYRCPECNAEVKRSEL